jgi:hypothetical protein
MLVGGWRFGGIVGGLASSEVADADGAVRVEAEDFVKGEYRGRGGGDDRAAEDRHLALVHVTSPNGKAAIDNRKDAEDEPEHHDDGQAVADAGLELGGAERLSGSREGVERDHGDSHEERRQPRADFRTDIFV